MATATGLNYDRKSFILPASFHLNIKCCGLYYKSFTVVIYNLNDNGLYYKTMIVANLALARCVNYDHKVCCKLKHTFMIASYDCKHLEYRPMD
jgi:hypothetical protein